MLKNIDPSDKSIRPFKVFKDFTLTNKSSGSGHLVLKAVSGSIHNFMTGSADHKVLEDMFQQVVDLNLVHTTIFQIIL